MNEYMFTLVLEPFGGGDVDLVEATDALVEAGCDDGTVAMINGVLHISFIREGESLEKAILSAVMDVATSKVLFRVVEIQDDRG